MFLRKIIMAGEKTTLTGHFFVLSLLVLTIKLLTLLWVNPTLTANEIIIAHESFLNFGGNLFLRAQTTIFYTIVSFLVFYSLRKNTVLATVSGSLILLWPSATYSGIFIVEPTSSLHISAFILAPLTAFLIAKYELIKLSKFVISTLFTGLLFFSLSSIYFSKNYPEPLQSLDYMLENKKADHLLEGVKVYLAFGEEKKVYIEEYQLYLVASHYVTDAEIIHANGQKPEPKTLYIANIKSTENDLMQKFGMNFEYSGTIDFEPYNNVRYVSTVYMVSEFKSEEKPETNE